MTQWEDWSKSNDKLLCNTYIGGKIWRCLFDTWHSRGTEMRMAKNYYVTPASVRLNSPALCHHHYVTLHREMATYFFMNWVSVLFERSLFPLLQDCLRNWFLCQLIGHAGLQISYDSTYFPIESGHPSDHFSAVDLEPPDPMVSVHIGQVSSMPFTRPMWVVFSLICQTCVT